jgi:hypothetical protein
MRAIGMIVGATFVAAGGFGFAAQATGQQEGGRANKQGEQFDGFHFF